REVKFRLNLVNIDIQERAIGKQASSSQLFDTISLRAVAPPETAWSLASLLLRENGAVLLHTNDRFTTEDEGFSQGVVRSCTLSVRGFITVVAKKRAT
ncbi:MAG: hypothetical protein F4077_06190, partial [Gammaproteobacteria bacterium]|nr:hypothetical protein [Gammaproteobacteria bacterium]